MDPLGDPLAHDRMPCAAISWKPSSFKLQNASIGGWKIPHLQIPSNPSFTGGFPISTIHLVRGCPSSTFDYRAVIPKRSHLWALWSGLRADCRCDSSACRAFCLAKTQQIGARRHPRLTFVIGIRLWPRFLDYICDYIKYSNIVLNIFQCILAHDDLILYARKKCGLGSTQLPWLLKVAGFNFQGPEDDTYPSGLGSQLLPVDWTSPPQQLPEKAKKIWSLPGTSALLLNLGTQSHAVAVGMTSYDHLINGLK